MSQGQPVVTIEAMEDGAAVTLHDTGEAQAVIVAPETDADWGIGSSLKGAEAVVAKLAASREAENSAALNWELRIAQPTSIALAP